MQMIIGRKWMVVGMMAVLSACAAVAQQSRPVDEAALKNAAQNADEWLTHGRDYSETYYSPLKQIDTSNAKRLGLAWYYDVDNAPGTIEATPIVSNGTIYGTGTWSVVFAVDARTGKLKWRWDPKIPHQNFPPGSVGKPDKVRTGPSVCCGPVNRGVAVYNGKVYLGLLDTRLVALDAETGKLVWEVKTADINADYSVTGAPRIVNGKVIIGNASGEYATRGYVTAYDAETGKQIWRWYTVPGDPSKPFENNAMKKAAKTWTGEWWKLGGGGNVWDSMSYDPETDLLYIGVGQGGPWVRNLRSPKDGDNLYICSIVALKASTGEYVWHYQTTPGDEWDYDAAQGMILTDLQINGKDAEGAAASSQERLLLRVGPQDREVHLGETLRGNHLDDGGGSEDRTSRVPARGALWRQREDGHGGARPGGRARLDVHVVQSQYEACLYSRAEQHVPLSTGPQLQARSRHVQLGNLVQVPGACSGTNSGHRAAASGRIPSRVGSGDADGALEGSWVEWRRHDDDGREPGLCRIE